MSPMGSATITSPMSPTLGAKGDSPRESIDYDSLDHIAGRYVEEEDSTLRLLDFFMSILSDIISHDCRYKVQNPRPSRPEWVLHSLVLDVLFYLARTMIQDHKSIYDIGMIALSAFPVFKNHSLVRLLDLLTDLILPSFAQSRTQTTPFIFTSPPVSPTAADPMSPSSIRVRLQNNTTFAIQVHSPTEENGMLSVPRHGRPSLTPRVSSTWSSSYSRSPLATNVQDTLDTHAGSLISLTLLSILEQISFSTSPLPVVKKLETSIASLLRIKPDLSADILEVIAIVENEKVMRRALEVLWWIGKPSLGHLVLGERFFPLHYDSILQMRQTRQEWMSVATDDIMLPNARYTSKSEALFSTFRRGSVDDSNVAPKTTAPIASHTSNSTRSRTKYRPSLPWRNGRASNASPEAPIQQQQQQTGTGADFLADHELYPYMFSIQENTSETSNSVIDMNQDRYCERCELVMRGYGLHCYHCRGSLHLECYYSVKRLAGVDCMLLGAAFEPVSRRPRNQLLYPEDSELFETPTNKVYGLRSGHHLQMVNLFSTCLCAACRMPLWGHHLQAYRCQDCSQLMHLDCASVSFSDCGAVSQPLALKHLCPTSITLKDLNESFIGYYKELIKTLKMPQSESTGATSLSSPLSPLFPPYQDKEKYSYEEASCNASVLSLQLELFRTGLERGDIQVLEWDQAQQSNPVVDPITTSSFELTALHKHFVHLAEIIRDQGQPPAHTLFLTDFFEDTKPDQFLLFSEAYWSHFAAIAKTMILNADAKMLDLEQQKFFSNAQTIHEGTLDEDDLFSIGIDKTQEDLLAIHSVQSSIVPLATIFRFCKSRLRFQSSWTMQVVLQEWLKLGLLERLDGEVSLFEPADAGTSTASNTPDLVASGYGRKPEVVIPLLRTTFFDDHHIASIAATSTSTALGIQSVPCHFPFVTAIDPSSQVENLIHAVWRCLSSVDLSINECGFLLLHRLCWPDPFMSDYTTERLVGCIFHWLLLEDDQLFVIHQTFSSKGKKIPGVRQGLDEQIAKKVVVLTDIHARGPSTPTETSSGPFDSLSGAREQNKVANGSATPGSGATSASLAAFMTATAAAAVTSPETFSTNTTAVNPLSATAPSAPMLTGIEDRSSSMAPNHFGDVGLFVRTRRLMAIKFAVPWLKKIMELDPDRYLEIVHRQIRVLEREMSTQEVSPGKTKEDHQKFSFGQCERYMDAITKLRQAGFLFSMFPKVLCLWLDEVEDMLEGMDITSRNFKALNRLYLKANQNSTGGSGSVLGQATGVGSGTSTPTGGSRLEGEWRARLRTKLHNHTQHDKRQSAAQSRKIGDLSGAQAGDLNNSDMVENANPVDSLRQLFSSGCDQGSKRAFYLLELMVQSKVQIPTQAFVVCCDRLIEMSGSPSMHFGQAPILPMSQESVTVQSVQLLLHSKQVLKCCWEYIIISSRRPSETEALQVLELVLVANQVILEKILDTHIQVTDPNTLESARHLVKYALAIYLYVHGCPLHLISSIEIVPTNANNKNLFGGCNQQATGLFWPMDQQHYHRQQYLSKDTVRLERESLPTSLFLKTLLAPALSLQGEVIKTFSVLMDYAGRVSNIGEFFESIHNEIVSCLWETLSPLYDHLSDTTLPFLMRIIFENSVSFQTTVSRCFNNPDWEVRFFALDSVYGLFSKLDDVTVQRLFFQQFAPHTTRVNATRSSRPGKSKTTDRAQNGHSSQYRPLHQRQCPEPSAMSFSNTSHPSTVNSDSPHNPPQGADGPSHSAHILPVCNQFSPKHLAILGPCFSYFVASMWDKEDAVRTKAKTLLKSLQPVHVVHSLKAWELHFVSSSADIQQSLLKLMTRLNNYFPSWKIMGYGLIFKLLTTGGLGRCTDKNGSNSSLSDVMSPGVSQSSPVVGATPSFSSKNEGKPIRRSSVVALSVDGIGPLSLASEPYKVPIVRSRRSSVSGASLFEHVHAEKQAYTDVRLQGRRASIGASALLESPFAARRMANAGGAGTGHPSRSQRRSSMAAVAKTTTSAASQASAVSAEAAGSETGSMAEKEEGREKQLALEDDLQCGLLNLALQMVSNGIEPRLDEVIQLKYLVVFYLDFEDCELLSLGQGKHQVRYGDYTPRHRTSPLQNVVSGDAARENPSLGILNDPGHENFVLAICMNLQLILDRHVEIKPEDELDPPSIYDHIQDAGHGCTFVDGLRSVTTTTRTFTSTTGTSENAGKDASRTSTGIKEGAVDPSSEDEYRHQHRSFFCFPRHRHHTDKHHHDRSQSRNASHESGQQKNQEPSQQKSQELRVPRYQQHHHHHYRRNRHRALDMAAPVVGTYFVDVILRFFGSEPDLTSLPSNRLKNWLELLLIVVYKYVNEIDPLSDVIVILMKRIVEMLMTKKSSAMSSSSADGTSGNKAATAGGGSGGGGRATTGMAPSRGEASGGDELMSEENILLAISICSTLLKRSSTMTTALLSREIMAMGKLMTKRREDPDDPVLIRAKNFLHDTFVHFMGNGLFVLVFKKPAYNMNSCGWVEEPEVDQELDLFYVLATVLGENEMVPPDPSSASSGAGGGTGKNGAPAPSSSIRLVHIREQPIRDILDRVMIFRDLDSVQVSTILTNLALYVERVHSRFEDTRLLADMGQFLVKITKYTAEWDHHQHHRVRERAQQLKQAHDLQRHQLLQHQQHPMKIQFRRRASANNLKSENNLVGESMGEPFSNSGFMSMMSESTAATVIQERNGFGPLDAIPLSEQLSRSGSVPEDTVTTAQIQRQSLSSSDSSSPLAPPPMQEQQQQSRMSSFTEIVNGGVGAGVGPSSKQRRNSVALQSMTSSDNESNSPFVQYQKQNQSVGGKATSLDNLAYPFTTKRGYTQAWDYVNPIMGMCSMLMIQNPMEGHALIPAIKGILRQSLYRDIISATSLIRLCTGYTYMAELDFSLALVNVVGEFVVEELKTSITKDAKLYSGRGEGRYGDEDGGGGLDENGNGHGYQKGMTMSIQPQTHGKFKSAAQGEVNEKKEQDKEKKRIKDIKAGGPQNSHHMGVGGAYQQQHVGGRTKILASNFHVLHHLLIWDLDPSYNMEWTRIKWDILGAMRFPPGCPLLFPGANDALRGETAAIVGDLFDD
ncbi:hypothetical protein BG004_002769 [Podila humilis]|nr:hypothetical protein BG004_002769 [Podila humilis]